MKKEDKNGLILIKPLPGLSVVRSIFILKLREYLKSNIQNPRLKAETVAKEMVMSKSTLNRRLKETLNLTINDFIKQYRLQQSVDLLNAGYKVNEVAHHVGFKTPSYFAQCFKAHFQKSPSELHKS